MAWAGRRWPPGCEEGQQGTLPAVSVPRHPLLFQEGPRPGTDSPGFPRGASIRHGHRWTTGFPEAETYPRSLPKDQMCPGRVDMGISALLSPSPPCLLSSHRNVPVAVPGSARWLALMDGAPWLMGPELPWPDLPMAWLACSDHPASCVYTWASSTVGGARGLTPGLSEPLAWVRARGQGPVPHGCAAQLCTGVDLPGRQAEPGQARG